MTDKNVRLLPLFLFCAYLGKSLVVSVSLADAGIVLALAGITIYFDWAVNKKQLTELQKKVADMDVTYSKDMELLKNNIASLKMNSGIRSAFAQK